MQLLDPSEYHRVRSLLRDVPINTLFARAVIEGHVDGRVWVDDRAAPASCYVAHPYGMSLLFGSPATNGFKRSLAPYLTGDAVDRTGAEWLQVFPNDWNVVLEAIFGRDLVRASSVRAESGGPSPTAMGRAVLDTRVNFRFNRLRYEEARRSLHVPKGCRIIADAGAIYSLMRGSVVPSAFWDSAADLRKRGAAFGVVCEGELASAAFASFAMDDVLELGIETAERFRGRGLAAHACRALIDRCIARDLQPVWACRLSNVPSYRLATRLGFDHVRSLPYYCLPMSRARKVLGIDARGGLGHSA